MAKTTEAVLLSNARARARRKGVAFTISLADVHVPELCPVLGLKLRPNWRRSEDNSPTLDRIRPGLGYVPGNVLVISHKANTIKAHATPAELERVAGFFRQLLE